MSAGSTVTIEADCDRPLVICTQCGTFGPYLNRNEARTFKARHSLHHQQARDAAAARARRAQ